MGGWVSETRPSILQESSVCIWEVQELTNDAHSAFLQDPQGTGCPFIPITQVLRTSPSLAEVLVLLSFDSLSIFICFQQISSMDWILPILCFCCLNCISSLKFRILDMALTVQAFLSTQWAIEKLFYYPVSKSNWHCSLKIAFYCYLPPQDIHLQERLQKKPVILLNFFVLYDMFHPFIGLENKNQLPSIEGVYKYIIGMCSMAI